MWHIRPSGVSSLFHIHEKFWFDASFGHCALCLENVPEHILFQASLLGRGTLDLGRSERVYIYNKQYHALGFFPYINSGSGIYYSNALSFQSIEKLDKLWKQYEVKHRQQWNNKTALQST